MGAWRVRSTWKLLGVNMNKVLTLTAVCLLSSLAFGSEVPNPILEKGVTAGFMFPPNATSFHCSVFTDHVEIVRTAGGLGVTSVKQVAITGNVQKLIDAAEQGQVTTQSAPTDGPITYYRAIKTLPGGAQQEIKLKASGSMRYQNAATEAATLVNFLDQACQ